MTGTPIDTHFPREPAPSDRTYTPGDWPSTAYRSQNGSELRILYGSKRLAATIQLVYNNITDAQAEVFLDHYDLVKGTYESFDAGGTTLNAGWTGTIGALNPVSSVEGTEWRYAGPPQQRSVFQGLSTMVINLVQVTVGSALIGPGLGG